MRGLDYQRLRNYGARTGESMSGIVTRLVRDFLDREEEPQPKILLPTTPRPEKKKEEDEIFPAHFTF